MLLVDQKYTSTNNDGTFLAISPSGVRSLRQNMEMYPDVEHRTISELEQLIVYLDSITFTEGVKLISRGGPREMVTSEGNTGTLHRLH